MAPDSNPVEEAQLTPHEPMTQDTALFLLGQFSFDHFVMRDPESQESYEESMRGVLEERESAVRASERASRVFTEADVEKAALALPAFLRQAGATVGLADTHRIVIARLALAALGDIP